MHAAIHTPISTPALATPETNPSRGLAKTLKTKGKKQPAIAHRAVKVARVQPVSMKKNNGPSPGHSPAKKKKKKKGKRTSTHSLHVSGRQGLHDTSSLAKTRTENAICVLEHAILE